MSRLISALLLLAASTETSHAFVPFQRQQEHVWKVVSFQQSSSPHGQKMTTTTPPWHNHRSRKTNNKPFFLLALHASISSTSSSSSSLANSTSTITDDSLTIQQQPQQQYPHLHHPEATAGPNGEILVHDELGIPLADPLMVEDKAAAAAAAGVVDWKERILSSYLGPRLILLVLAAVYATNFPLGAVMNAHLPASAATTARMVLAATALAPFIRQLSPELRWSAILCGCFTATGYVTQSLALQDTDPARVSFLGSATVLWCPLLELLIEKKPMAWHQAPQVWLAAVLCLAGVGVLELSNITAEIALALEWHTGDLLAMLQAVGFGTGVFWTSRMLSKRPDQALPVTATLLATTSFLAMLWSFVDGWVLDADNLQTMALPGLLFADPVVAGAVVWTGLISTSLNFYIELTALGRVNPSEASVLLASEPLWAALFAAAFLGASLSQADAVGGALIVSACLVNAVVTPEMLGMKPAKDDNNVDDGIFRDI